RAARAQSAAAPPSGPRGRAEARSPGRSARATHAPQRTRDTRARRSIRDLELDLLDGAAGDLPQAQIRLGALGAHDQVERPGPRGVVGVTEAGEVDVGLG